MFVQSTSHLETQSGSDQRGDFGSLHHHGSAYGKVCPPDPPRTCPIGASQNVCYHRFAQTCLIYFPGVGGVKMNCNPVCGPPFKLARPSASADSTTTTSTKMGWFGSRSSDDARGEGIRRAEKPVGVGQRPPLPLFFPFEFSASEARSGSDS